jgi:hypothetical protein
MGSAPGSARRPALTLLLSPGSSHLLAVRSISPRALEVGRRVLEPVVAERPDLARNLDEMAETMIRLLISLLTVGPPRKRGEAALRAFLRRRLLPALGL